MKDFWQNNRISKKLNEEYPRDFSICDIDGAVRCFYGGDVFKIRFIIYESKNDYEKITETQLKTLKLLSDSINWKIFDDYSGVVILKIIDIDDRIVWEDLNGNIIRTTNFKELYNIFSCKI